MVIFWLKRNIFYTIVNDFSQSAALKWKEEAGIVGDSVNAEIYQARLTAFGI